MHGAIVEAAKWNLMLSKPASECRVEISRKVRLNCKGFTIKLF